MSGSRTADERTTLLAFLAEHRAMLRRRTAGLDAAQLDATLPPSEMTLGGMLAHLAYVEDWWIGVTLLGEPARPPFADVDWEADNDHDWHLAAGRSPEELHALLADFTARSDAVLAEVTDLDTVAVRRNHHTGEGLSLRWILVHLIEEYAQHNGHADLIRQSIDGAVAL